MNKLKFALQDTDWSLLAKQKMALLDVIGPINDKEQAELLDGLLNWLDAVMDGAEAAGFPVVFLTERDGGTA